MTRSIGRLVLTVLLAAAFVAGTSAGDDQQKGRYKKQGDNCVWDANDSGPNQCAPTVAGRFKQEGDKCVWAPNDKGPDQCRPPKGRWKTEGEKCVFNPNDDGPDQCNPRRPR
jgi:hypothetical protein